MALLLAGGCAAGPKAAVGPATTAPPSTAPTPVSGLAVGSGEATLVDPSRPTEVPGVPAVAGRTIDLKTFVPEAEGRFPLVVFAHGLGGDLDKQDALLEMVASHGYVAVAVRFPLTGDAGGRVVADFVNQPADLDFVLDELLARPPEPLVDRIDGDRVALIGHSLGGATVLAGSLNSCCQDDRVDAVVAIAAVNLPFPDGEYFEVDRQPPVLFVQGDADATVRDDFRLSARYPEAAAPKFLLTVLGGSHVSPVEGDATAELELVAGTITAFFDQYLKGDPAGVDRLTQLVADHPDQAVLTAER